MRVRSFAAAAALVTVLSACGSATEDDVTSAVADSAAGPSTGADESAPTESETPVETVRINGWDAPNRIGGFELITDPDIDTLGAQGVSCGYYGLEHVDPADGVAEADSITPASQYLVAMYTADHDRLMASDGGTDCEDIAPPTQFSRTLYATSGYAGQYVDRLANQGGSWNELTVDGATTACMGNASWISCVRGSGDILWRFDLGRVDLRAEGEGAEFEAQMQRSADLLAEAMASIGVS